MQNIVDSYVWNDQRKILTPNETGVPALRTFGINMRQQALQPLAPHIHRGCIEIVFLVSGFQVYEASNASFNLSGSDIFVAYPDEPHSTNGYLESVNNIIWMQLDLSPEIPFLGLEPGRAGQLREALLALPRIFSGNDGLRHMLMDAFYSLGSSEPFDRFYGEQQLVCALLRMLRLAGQPHQRKSDRISDAITYIHDHIAEPISLEDAAAACALSVSRFKVCFKSETGVTPREYINQIKIRQAQRLLDSGSSVTQTAMALGFTTPNYFSVLFKKYTCMTPTEYLHREE